MGDPKKTRKKYETPRHPWNKDRIEEEKILLREYGIRNKKEIHKMRSILRKFKDQAKKLIALKTAQGEKEKQQMFAKLNKLGLLQESTSLDPVLDLALRDVLERRLQTQVYKKNLAKSVNQARQFITHGHINIGSKRVTSPSYILSTQEEIGLNFSPGSKLNDLDHPERFVEEEKKEVKEKKAGKPEEKKRVERKTPEQRRAKGRISKTRGKK
ncbi:30S ribosomal protein S4 [Thermoproteota archaeon]